MPWQTITEDDVRARLSGPELAAYKTAALATSQTDPLPEVISQTVAEVRGYIAACERNTLEEGETVPSKLVSATVAIIRYRLITRLPLNAASLLETRRDEYKDAVALLKEVAACRFLVEESVNPAAEAPASPRPRYCAREREFTRRHQDGA